MLYERWREVARRHHSEIALNDLATGRRWTFGQLAAAVDHGTRTGLGKFAFQRGAGAEFVLGVLEAWRAGEVVCPLEPGQFLPNFEAELPEDCVHLKTTSATTGTPQAVAFTASQLEADAANIVATMGLRPEWPNLGVVSLAHSYGFSNLVLPLLLHGIPLVIGESAMPEGLRRGGAATPFLTLPGVPALWRAWHDARVIPPHTKLAISAGAPLPLALEEEIFSSTGIKVHNFYGSTECGGIAFDRGSGPRLDASCVGEPLANVRLTVSDQGSLEVYGAAVGQSYWPVSDARLHDGCFRTGDLAELVNGHVFLRGRANDQINVAGRKVSPEAIEAVLLGHPGVRNCLVFGVASGLPERGDDIVACISCIAPERGTAELKSFASARLPDWQVPREWWFVPALEANQRGKLSRAAWRRRFLETRRV